MALHEIAPAPFVRQPGREGASLDVTCPATIARNPPLRQESHRESDDTYRGEIFRAGNWRVIICKDGIQFILQRRSRAESPDGARWLAVSYCATREALVRLWGASTDADGASLRAILPPFAHMWREEQK